MSPKGIHEPLENCHVNGDAHENGSNKDGSSVVSEADESLERLNELML